ncbi:MAG: TetR/AcrR family transcriptional regulator [Bacteroidales bacterium]
MKRRLLQVSRDMFLRYGYSKIRIDEIAAELNISKKTIYNHFGSKEELLFEVIEMSKLEIEQEFAAIESNPDLQFEDKVKASLSLLGLWVSKVQVLIQDLKKNLPEAYTAIVKFNKEILVKGGIRILEEGVQLGLFKEGWSLNMALYMFVAVSEKLFADSFNDAMPAEMVSGFPLSLEERLYSVIEIIYSGVSK